MRSAEARNLARAYRMARYGYESRTPGDNIIPIDPTWGDVFKQGLGLTSARKAEAAELTSAYRTTQQLMQYRQQVISNEVYRAMDQGDWQKMQANWNLANDFAVRHGMPPFNPTPGYQQRVMERFMGAAQGVGMLMGKPKDLPTLAQYRYGTQPGPSPANP
jgi:hypothetical protein